MADCINNIETIENTIEDKIKSLGYNYCRACHHFIRVNFDNYRNVYNRQGFCILGELKGDYGLYISCSSSKECMGFIISDKNYQITKSEKELSTDCDEYLHSLNDKRTKNYQEILPLLQAHEDFFKRAKDMKSGMAWLMADKKIRSVGYEHFYEGNIKRYKEIYDMVKLKRSDYLKFLAKLSVEMHDKFCSCNKIDYRGE